MMKTYAFIYMGKIWQVIQPVVDEKGNQIPLSSLYTPDFCDQCVDITGMTPIPQENWIATEASGTWTFTLPA